jgi:hypothetical protein
MRLLSTAMWLILMKSWDPRRRFTMADKDDEEPKGMQDPKVVQLFKQNNQRGTKTVKQILSEITEGSIVVDIDETLTNPDNVMQRSMGHFENIILIGTNEDGHMEVRSSLNLTVKDMLWMLEMTKQNILLTALSHDEDDNDDDDE